MEPSGPTQVGSESDHRELVGDAVADEFGGQGKPAPSGHAGAAEGFSCCVAVPDMPTTVASFDQLEGIEIEGCQGEESGRKGILPGNGQ